MIKTFEEFVHKDRFIKDIVDSLEYAEIISDLAELDCTSEDYWYEDSPGIFINSFDNSKYGVFLDRESAEEFAQKNSYDGEVREYVYGKDKTMYYVVIIEPSKSFYKKRVLGKE